MTAKSRLQAERTLYRRLLTLGEGDVLPALLEDALEAVVAAVGARRGYLQLDERGDDDAPRWWIARGFEQTEISAVRAHLSAGIIAAAIASGETIQTASAVGDPRFADRRSVQTNAISAVLCVPIGRRRALGALYLEGNDAQAPFDEGAVELAGLFGHHLSPLVDRLLQRERAVPDPTHTLRARLSADTLLGRSAAIAGVLDQVAMVCPLDITVLITGSSGSGKSLLAKLIHDNSRRASRPFVALNCATIPEALMESELFGAAAGAHSTATRSLPGKVRAAEGGTLFLDEISELSLSAQAKLLQLLQDKTYFPLGSASQKTADIRVLAATNTDLTEAVAGRRFREDLMYRLTVLPIRMPTLAERPDDIPLLARHFCTQTARTVGKPGLRLGPVAVEALQLADWPGNVRQLAHCIQAGILRAVHSQSPVVESHHLFPTLRAPLAAPALTFQAATLQFQRQLLTRTLDDTGWNISEAARRLEITRSYLHRLIRTHALTRQ